MDAAFQFGVVTSPYAGTSTAGETLLGRRSPVRISTLLRGFVRPPRKGPIIISDYVEDLMPLYRFATRPILLTLIVDTSYDLVGIRRDFDGTPSAD